MDRDEELRRLREAISLILDERKLPFQLKPLQTKVLESVIVHKRDVLAILPTGYGKTLIYSLLPGVRDEFMNINDEKPTASSSTSAQQSIVIVISPLIALMEDQVINIEESGARCIYASKKQSDDVYNELLSGKISIVMLSPEAVFSNSWWDLLNSDVYKSRVSTLVIDECHLVEQWGEEFRTDYGKLAELRSILPNATVLALTASAIIKTRKVIISKLGLINPMEIEGSSDRENIKLYCVRAPYAISSTFAWLVAELKAQREKCPKTIIYCRSIKSCSLLYKYFSDTLGDDMYAFGGQHGVQFSFIAMFHHSTSKKCKSWIIEEFPKAESTARIIFATSAFGMGVNVPDIKYVLQWGAPRTFSGYMQEFGRAGRDGRAAVSVVYHHPTDTSRIATEGTMATYIKSDTCRREILIQHFSPNIERVRTIVPLHVCCDNCEKLCKCGNCPEKCLFELQSLAENAEGHGDSDMIIQKNISEDVRDKIKDQLFLYRQSLCREDIEPTLLNLSVLTCISDDMITSITSNAHYISCEEDLFDYVYNKTIASDIMNILQSLLG